MRRKYAPVGWYKRRNAKIYDQSKQFFARDIAAYWRLDIEYVKQIIKAERIAHDGTLIPA